jgi:hypothetical protein
VPYQRHRNDIINNGERSVTRESSAVLPLDILSRGAIYRREGGPLFMAAWAVHWSCRHDESAAAM